jgi:hypothetical protein
MYRIGKREIHVANPHEKDWVGEGFRDCKRWVLWFGACGPTYVLIYSQCLEDALEEAAGFLADRFPGHFVEPEMEDGLTHDCPDAKEGFPCTCDLTYTESGYIAGWEWGIAIENASRADLVRFYHADRN